ncbi:hypothetical protein QZH41_015614 [Actinostola sp. cb2023]|nr:hypothetical protein QZH41_015614 [Actinostola sp. cb2023]
MSCSGSEDWDDGSLSSEYIDVDDDEDDDEFYDADDNEVQDDDADIEYYWP